MGILSFLLNILIVICSIFLICLVLIQRGRGGGLAGAFGGLGGSSAFGTKAGDVFTRVTVITAIVWFTLAMALVIINNNRGQSSAFDEFADTGSGTRQVTPTDVPTGDTPPSPIVPPPTTPSEVPAGGTAAPPISPPGDGGTPDATGTGTTPPAE